MSHRNGTGSSSAPALFHLAPRPATNAVERKGKRGTDAPPVAAAVRDEVSGKEPSRRKPDFDWEHQDPANGAWARVYVGDCREILPRVPEVARGEVDLVFADPPFNWNRAYDKWHDAMPTDEYLEFTYAWLDLCIGALRPHGSIWVNIPDDWAAEIVVHLKRRGLFMVNWCIWHYRFGQNCTERFINSKVHALYFSKQDHAAPPRQGPMGRGSGRAVTAAGGRTWNPGEILEMSDRASIYNDPRTYSKNDGMPAGKRVPMDVWYGQYWGRIQGNNKERRHGHDNQLPEVYLERVVRACSNPGDTVLDPFLGSGTTGVIAHALGRNFIGTEFSMENARRAVERMKTGPIRLGAALGQSSAIFEKRARGEKRRRRIEKAKAWEG